MTPGEVVDHLWNGPRAVSKATLVSLCVFKCVCVCLSVCVCVSVGLCEVVDHLWNGPRAVTKATLVRASLSLYLPHTHTLIHTLCVRVYVDVCERLHERQADRQTVKILINTHTC